MSSSVAIYTLGCKLNFSESSTIYRQLTDHGFRKANFEDGADLYVINTCSVTDNADKKCRKVVKEALKLNPEAYVVVVGCYAQLKPTEIATIPGVDMVLGAAEKFNLAQHLQELKKEEKAKVLNMHIKETTDFIAGYSFGDRTRSFLKVQDGCNYFCSFCTIPLARGRSRSDSIEATVAQARQVAESGVKEIVLTGVNIGDFGRPRGETFLDLVKALEEVESIERFRISSIEPNLLTNEIINHVSRSKKFVPHFHIPLQSGSDKILKLMRRRYERSLYADRVAQIKTLMPDACIGVDVIVGFPHETQEDFLDTYNFLNGLDISYLHVFPYSERVNTTAYRMEAIVPMKERGERAQMLRILSEKKRRAFYETQIGKIRPVLFEAEQQGSFMEGFTDNYVKVQIPYDPLLVNEIIPMKLLQVDNEGHMLSEDAIPVTAHH